MMKHQLIVFFLYVLICLTAFIFDFRFSNAVIIVLTILLCGYQVYMFLQLTKTAPAGDTVFRKQSASIRPIFIVLALIPTVGYFINGRFNVWQIVIFWTIVLYDSTISLLTKKLKPIAIVIDGEELKLNNQIKTSRNLASLKSMSLNGFTDYIKLTFTNQIDLYIKRNDFSNEDMQRMIELFGRKSKDQLIISENLKNI